jgi:hypothetical protein
MLFNVLDVLTTHYGVFKLGLFEENPFARLLFDNGMFKMALLVKFMIVFLVASVFWFAYHYHKLNYQINQGKWDKVHMNLYYSILILLTVLFMGVVINNTVWIVRALHG